MFCLAKGDEGLTGEIINRPNSHATRRQLRAFSEIGNRKVRLGTLLMEKRANFNEESQTFTVCSKRPSMQGFICRNGSFPNRTPEALLIINQNVPVCSRYRDEYPEGVSSPPFVHPDASLAVEMPSEVFNIRYLYRHLLSIDNSGIQIQLKALRLKAGGIHHEVLI